MKSRGAHLLGTACWRRRLHNISAVEGRGLSNFSGSPGSWFSSVLSSGFPDGIAVFSGTPTSCRSGISTETWRWFDIHGESGGVSGQSHPRRAVLLWSRPQYATARLMTGDSHNQKTVSPLRTLCSRLRCSRTTTAALPTSSSASHNFQLVHRRGGASTSSSFPSGIEPDGMPSSERPQFYNRFDYADSPEAFIQDKEVTPKHPPATSPGDLVEPTNHPHQVEGWVKWERYTHYNYVTEPTFQRHPDKTKGELISGSNFYRTNAWKEENEPAIVSVARYNPENIRPVGYAENAPRPDSMNPEEIPDFRAYRLPQGSPDRRAYTYFVTATAFVATASMARSFICAVVGFFWIPKGLVLAGRAEVDLSKIDVGREVTVDYRGKPCFVKHRTAAQISRAHDDDKLLDTLRDPELDSQRTQVPQWLVVSAVCTHLGCIPHEGGSYGGFFCPCHGSHYDTSGRIRAGPAPSNLVVPPYKFLDDNTILIGD